MTHDEHTCPAGYMCRECRQTTCVPCDIGQPDCAHAQDYCADCRMSCAECRADRAEDEGSAA